MGYSGRYHAASLAAVFLALAVGILIGVGFGSDVVSGTAESLEESLASDLDQARAQVDELEAQLESERGFGAEVYPAIVGGELRGDRIALIGLGDLDSQITAEVEDALGPAGATLEEVAVVREPPDLDALASTLKGNEARAVARGGEDLRLFAERAGRALVSGNPDFDELRGTLLSRFSGRPGRIDGVVVVRQRPTELDPDQQAATDLLEDGLLAGVASRNTPSVGVERTDSDPSSIQFFESHTLATVDSVDLTSGRVALVFALDGAAGNFGVKETADSLLPELLAPDGEGDGSANEPGSSAQNR